MQIINRNSKKDKNKTRYKIGKSENMPLHGKSVSSGRQHEKIVKKNQLLSYLIRPEPLSKQLFQLLFRPLVLETHAIATTRSRITVTLLMSGLLAVHGSHTKSASWFILSKFIKKRFLFFRCNVKSD